MEKNVDYTSKGIKGTVMTVLGPLDAKRMGKTLSHEHIFCDFTCFLKTPQNEMEAEFMEQPLTMENLWRMHFDPYSLRDECFLDDMDIAIRELEWFKEAGGQTITEVSLEGIGRDAVRLAKVSKKTGVNIICGTGHYLDETIPDYVRPMTADQLADRYIDEINNGIGDTGIRPGVIGELGTGILITPDEEKTLRAAARAQRETGLAITIHVHPGELKGHKLLDLLVKEEGVDPEKIILGHMDMVLTRRDMSFRERVDHIISLAERGRYVEFDLCGNTTIYNIECGLPTDQQRAVAIKELWYRGFSDKVVLSHDQGLKHFLRSYGGWGYAYVPGFFQEMLVKEGIPQDIALKFITDNPARALTIEK